MGVRLRAKDDDIPAANDHQEGDAVDAANNPAQAVVNQDAELEEIGIVR